METTNQEQTEGTNSSTMLKSGAPAHTLSQEDRIKGGKTSKPNNKLNALKHGKYVQDPELKKNLPFCKNCPLEIQSSCKWYNQEDGARCKMSILNIQQIALINRDPLQFNNEIAKALQWIRFKFENKEPTIKELMDFIKIMCLAKEVI
jgi:hypothetical protein